MFVVYSRVTDAEIRKSQKSLIKQAREWFEKNPKRKTARVELFYGKIVTLTRTNYVEDIKKAIEKAIADNKKQT